ncbi:putative vacuolar ATP synthase, C subunit [Cryptosporidium serpentis]|uniref:V-type proton ATPase proteolipid subunit n=2 Tax=Cryptosporidium TaxID=5806 RepID=B6AHB7_CRYMR|nr:vacuolar ATP synthase, C subunit, putative [Cryptosporidium muris RN66]EEA07612.1 vacuolar ATP synthase, C subunit, putative [Cryptosporidium muris RN66]OII75125.1 vacuolar ATP synthase C subunit [Cryptosporidium andersoni]|eukprot:XP_002141961.1 vacuolar ATP synthase, C subunit [Cryptosporidium muris RN66]
MITCDPNSLFFGFMGIAGCVVFANLGAAYGTARAGVGISSMGVMRPELIMKSIIPAVMAGILGIYGLIGALVIFFVMGEPNFYSSYLAYAQMSAGLIIGLSCLAAGLAIGIVGDAGVRAAAQQPRLLTGMILILIFGEALAIYGLIVGLILGTTKVPGQLCASYT